MIEIKRSKTGLEIEFINLVNKPVLIKLDNEFIQKRLREPDFKGSNRTILDLIPKHYSYINNLDVLNQRQLNELDNWFNQPVEELLKHLDDR